MRFTTFLSKHFDIEEDMLETDFSEGKHIKAIFVFNKGEDMEPEFILYNVTELDDPENALARRMAGNELYRIGNISSKLEHGSVVGEKELRDLIKKKQY